MFYVNKEEHSTVNNLPLCTEPGGYTSRFSMKNSFVLVVLVTTVQVCYIFSTFWMNFWPCTRNFLAKFLQDNWPSSFFRSWLSEWDMSTAVFNSVSYSLIVAGAGLVTAVVTLGNAATSLRAAGKPATLIFDNATHHQGWQRKIEKTPWSVSRLKQQAWTAS